MHKGRAPETHTSQHGDGEDPARNAVWSPLSIAEYYDAGEILFLLVSDACIHICTPGIIILYEML